MGAAQDKLRGFFGGSKATESDLNPQNQAGAQRLMKDPGALDEAIERGLGRAEKDPTYDGKRK